MKTYTSTDIFNQNNQLVYLEANGQKIGEIKETKNGFTAKSIQNQTATFIRYDIGIDFLIRAYQKATRTRNVKQDINQTTLFI